MILKLCLIIGCHLIGDYVLQSNYIAKNKGKNWYLMFVHCFLYCIPFALVFGFDYRLMTVIVTHFMIDTAKARLKCIDIVGDQIMHYFIAILLYINNAETMIERYLL